MRFAPQATLGGTVTLSGIGLHTGRAVTMRLSPAPAGHGIRFVRADLEGKPGVRVGLGNMTGGVRGTNVGRGPAAVHTVEHLLAACMGCGVDNLEVELDGPEPPACDGSAAPLVALLWSAGRVEQEVRRPVFRVVRPASVGDENGRVTAVPSPGFRVSYTLKYDNPLIGCQLHEATFSRETFATELAPARTFCLAEEVAELRRQGLGLGGSLENALVVDGPRVHNEGGLRFADEFARHKVLDVVGDFASLGGDVQAHVIALRSGHRHNIALLEELLESEAMVQMQEDRQVYDVQEIRKLLPHRFPFLLIDRITLLEAGVRARGIKNVTINEPFFQGHFPQHPVMPGVLICEAMAQVAGVCILSLPEHRGKIPYFTGLDGVLFRRPVVPGDQVVIDITVDRLRGNLGKVQGKALVEEKVAAEGILKFMVL